MSERWNRIAAIAGLVLVLAAANFAVWSHERTLAEGRVLLLELAPVDPRSIMQGDYMALRFAVGDRVGKEAPRNGRMVLKVAADGTATFARLHREGEPLAADEALLEYRVRQSGVRIVTDAYFFQEGTANTYSRARYGELRVKPGGQALLVGLRDASKARLGVSRYAAH